MNAKTGIAVVALVLLWATIGGCPAPTSVPDDLTDPGGTTPADASGDDGASDDADDSAGGDGGATDDGSSSDDGSADGTDDGGTDTGSGDGSSSDDDGTDGSDDTDGDDPNDGDVTPLFAGTYSGEVTCVKRESVYGGDWQLEQEWTANRTMTFDANGYPAAIVVPGYGQAEGGIEFVAEVSQVGDTDTITEAEGTYTATITVTVALATYTETTARLVLTLEHLGQSGNLLEDGTGVQVVEFELVGGGLPFTSQTTYDVDLVIPDDPNNPDDVEFRIPTGWQVDCQGTLHPG